MDNEKSIKIFNFKLTDCKNIFKITALRKIIMALILFLVVLVFAVFIGIFHYPKWYVITNFMFNKKHFETILNNKEVDNLISVSQIEKSDCSDEINKSLKKLFKYGIYQSFNITYERDYSNSLGYVPTDDVEICVFTTKSPRHDKRGIVYSNTDIRIISLADGNVYSCHYLGDGWYYFQYSYKDYEKG